MTYRVGQAQLIGDTAFIIPPASDTCYIVGRADNLRALISDLQAITGKMSPHSFDDQIWKEIATDAEVDSYARDRCPCVACIQKASLINRIRSDTKQLKAERELRRAYAVLLSAIRDEAVRASEDRRTDGSVQWSGGLHRIVGMVNAGPKLVRDADDSATIAELRGIVSTLKADIEKLRVEMKRESDITDRVMAVLNMPGERTHYRLSEMVSAIERIFADGAGS